MNQHQPDSGKSRWWSVVGACLGLIVGNGPIMQFTFGIFLLPVTKEFGWARSQASLALFIGLTATAICIPIAGRLMDHYGVKRVSLPAIVIFAAATAALAFVPPSPAAFIALYAIMGAAAAGQSPLPYAKIISSSFDEHRGLALGISMAGVGIGTALVPQLAQYVVSVAGWKTAYLVLGALTFVIATFAMVVLIRETDRDRSLLVTKAPVPGLTPGEAIRTSQFWVLAASFLAVAVATNGTIAHVVPMLGARGLSPAVAATALAGAGAALTGGRLVAGWLLDRIHAPYVAAMFFLLPLAGIAVLISDTSLQMSYLAVVLIGLGLGAEVDLIAFLLSRYFGMRSFGEIYGYLFMLFMFGNGLGPWILGIGFDLSGSYAPCLTILCVALGIATALLFRLGPYRFPRTSPSTIDTQNTAPAH